MICNVCGEVFDEPSIYREQHGDPSGCYEEFYECPYCGWGDISEGYGDDEEET